jgi:hypothetical protein
MIDQVADSAAVETYPGVICLHCGFHTPLPESVTGRAATPGLRLFIIRCFECGKEGSYFGHEIVPFKAGAAKFVV